MTVVFDLPTALVCWQYHEATGVLVCGCSDSTIYIRNFKTDQALKYTLWKPLPESDKTASVISLDFDLIQVNQTTLRCVLSNYAGAAHILDITVAPTIKVIKTPLQPMMINRSLLFSDWKIGGSDRKDNHKNSTQWMMLIGEQVRIYTGDDKQYELLHLIESKEFEKDGLGPGGSLKVGEYVSLKDSGLQGYLYVSSHEGKMFRVDVRKGTHELVPNLYADAFKFWMDGELLIASNNRAHTMSVYKFGEYKQPLLTFNVIKQHMDREYPYPSIIATPRYALFPATPDVTTFLTVSDNQVIKFDATIPTRILALPTKRTVFVVDPIPREGTCEIESLCFTTLVKRYTLPSEKVIKRLSLSSSKHGDWN